MWEDPQNCDGGRWVLNLDKKHHNTSLDIYWLNTVSIILHHISNSTYLIKQIKNNFQSCWLLLATNFSKKDHLLTVSGLTLDLEETNCLFGLKQPKTLKFNTK